MAEEKLRKRGLGMGLSALLGTDPVSFAAEQRGGRMVPIEFLRPSPLQPRRSFDVGELEALAGSIRDKGVLQPLLVRPSPHGAPGYEIVAGERRWRAAQQAGLHEVPVVVRELGDAETLELALVENVQRADLNPIDEASALRRLGDEFGHTQEALARLVGKSRSHIANTLRLLALPGTVREMVEAGTLSAGHARALIGARDAERLALAVVERGLSVRATEDLVRQAPAPTTRRNGEHRDADTADLENRLSQSLGLRVGIRSRGTGGQLTIHWRDHAQLDGLLSRLR